MAKYLLQLCEFRAKRLAISRWRLVIRKTRFSFKTKRSHSFLNEKNTQNQFIPLKGDLNPRLCTYLCQIKRVILAARQVYKVIHAVAQTHSLQKCFKIKNLILKEFPGSSLPLEEVPVQLFCSQF